MGKASNNLDEVHLDILKLVNQQNIPMLTRLYIEMYKTARVRISLNHSLLPYQKITTQANADISE